MAFVTGTASTRADLITAIKSACTANGWTLTSGVLSKGSTHILLADVSSHVTVQGGTGNDGSGALTGACPRKSRIGSLSTTALTFPVTYDIHVFGSPDEVYVVINYASAYYQFIFFGGTDVPDLPGSGCWFAATKWDAGTGGDFCCSPSGGTTQYGFGAMNACPAFYVTGYIVTDQGQNTFFHHDLDSRGWSTYDDTANLPMSFAAQNALLSALPNTWNQETVLLPFPIWVPRSSGNKISMVADLKNIRHCRNDYLAAGEIVTIGAVDWKVYPWYRKDAAIPDGDTNGGDHSGTVAFAVRYTGP